MRVRPLPRYGLEAFLSAGLMPHADMSGIVAGLLQNFRQGHLILVEACTLWRHNLRLQHMAAHRQASGQDGGSSGRASGLRIHPGEGEALARKSVDVRGRVAAHMVQHGVTHLAESHIVYQHKENIGPLATVLPADRGQFFIDLFVLFRPAFPMLFKEVTPKRFPTQI